MRRLIAGVSSLAAAALVAAGPAGCSGQGGQGGQGAQGGSGANLPLLTPPVRAATPLGFGGWGANPLHPVAANVRATSITADGGADAADIDGGFAPGPSFDASPGPGPCPGLGPDASPGSCPGPSFDASPGPGSDASPMPSLGPNPGSEGGVSPAGGMGLDAANVKSRFFSAGPTNIFSILGEIDGRINEINERSRGKDVPCLSQPAVPYTLTPFGQSVPFYAQCVSQVSTPTPTSATPARAAFFQFGQKDGTTYLYETIGAESIGARVAPVVGSPGQYTVDAWMGVGYENATGCGNSTHIFSG